MYWLIEKPKLPKGVILVSMDATSIYITIPQEEGINIVCPAYEFFDIDKPPIPKLFLEKALGMNSMTNSSNKTVF